MLKRITVVDTGGISKVDGNQKKNLQILKKKTWTLFGHASPWNRGISSIFWWEMYSDSELLNKPVSLHGLDIQILIS